MDLATSCYEYACTKYPSNLELMMGLFNCYVREYSYVKQQQVQWYFYFYFVHIPFDILFLCLPSLPDNLLQTALKMYKTVGEERFLLWAVCSIQLQVRHYYSHICMNCIIFIFHFKFITGEEIFCSL